MTRRSNARLGADKLPRSEVKSGKTLAMRHRVEDDMSHAQSEKPNRCSWR
jgi:hypothetical protein